MTYPSVLPAIDDNGVVFNNLRNSLHYVNIDMFGQNWFYEVNTTNVIITSLPLTLTNAKILGFRDDGVDGQAIICDVFSGILYEADGTAGVQVTLGSVATYGGSISAIEGIYASTSNRFYVVYRLSGGAQPGYHVGYWD